MRVRSPVPLRPVVVGPVVCLAATLAAAPPLGPVARAEAPPAAQDRPADSGLHRAPAEGGARRWQVTAGDDLALQATPAAAAAVVSIQPAGAILSNLGCAAAAGRLWCTVRPFRGGARGVAPARRLEPARGPDGIIPIGVDDSRRRARRRDFDAEATIPCAQERGQAPGRCRAAVARGDGGDATIAVTFPTGFTRLLYFVHGDFVAASATMSGTGTDTDWRLETGRHRIRVDDQRYELPDSLVFGTARR